MKLDFEEQLNQLDQWIDCTVDINHQLISVLIVVPIKPDNHNLDILSSMIALYAVLLRCKTEMWPGNVGKSAEEIFL